MTEQEAQALYAQGEAPVVSKLLEQDARIRELEAQRATDSRNSSKPPSTDGYHKPAPKSSRKKTGRKPGGQKGHPGSTLALSENPDRVIPHPVTTCLQCGLDLSTSPAEVERRQVIDIPPLRLEVVEHRFESKACPCCHAVTTSHQDAPEVTAPTQYGPRIKALAVYLKTYQLLPFKRGAELIRTLFGGTLCEGTLANMVKGVSGTLDAPLAAITSILTDAKVAHFDETGSSVKGKLHWFHVASTEKVTLYTMHQRRGAAAMEDMGVLPKFSGRAIHDHWKPYFKFKGCCHGLCNAHHLRELTFIHEVVGQEWAASMKDLLLKANAAVDTAKAENRTRLDDKEVSRFVRRYKRIIAMALAVNPPPVPVPGKRGKPKDSKAGNLARRLRDHRREALAFMYDFSVPFSNNLAERDIRMMKVQQKVSGTFRSPEGATNFCRIRSYLSTSCKQGMASLAVLAKAIAGCPFMPQAD
ncbi:MAG: IS66 family transposase [Desulfuromonadales bacterium]|nr:IS66 family transposase [Desulfuromonadales bacterium]